MPEAQEPNPNWDGGRITNRIGIWQHESFENTWIICGKEDHLAAMGSPEDMVRLAHMIIEHLGTPEGENERRPTGPGTADSRRPRTARRPFSPQAEGGGPGITRWGLTPQSYDLRFNHHGAVRHEEVRNQRRQEQPMPEPVYVVYHAECRDGFGAAWAAWTALGHRTDGGYLVYYRATKHGETPPKTDPDGRLYILDFSFNLETMTRLWEHHGGRVTLLDHHQSAMLELQGKVPGCHFDMEKSGAVIAWNYFHPMEPLPDLLAYVQDRDLWQWNLPDSREVSAALEQEPMEFKAWSKLDTAELARKGSEILAENRRQVDRQVKTAGLSNVGGTTVPSVETDNLVSETAERLLALNPDAPFVAVYHRTETEAGLPATKFSLRSNGRADVSAIAKRLGGGGHPNAAGFTVTDGQEVGIHPD